MNLVSIYTHFLRSLIIWASGISHMDILIVRIPVKTSLVSRTRRSVSDEIFNCRFPRSLPFKLKKKDMCLYFYQAYGQCYEQANT